MPIHQELSFKVNVIWSKLKAQGVYEQDVLVTINGALKQKN
jgi:hypothetical protein